MTNFRVIPIPTSVSLRIRGTRRDDLGHQLSVSVATKNDTGPCRSCLTVFVPGEGRILCSYAQNQWDHPYNEIGPIYIHERQCQSYTEHELFPPELRTRSPLTLRCYAEDGMMIDAELVGDRAVEEVIRRLFKKPEVRYLHARTASLGCYIARIERA